MTARVPRVRRYPRKPIVRQQSLAEKQAMWNLLYGEQFHVINPDGTLTQIDPARVRAFTYTTLARPVSQGEPQ